MPVIDFLERNVKLYGNETALVELNPEIKETRRMTWKEYALIQPTTDEPYRREITWNVFNEKANRFANMLLSRGVKKGDKVAILMYNCLEWLPIYFGILKTGALAVPFNFRYSAEEIEYCADLAEVQVLVFGPEFIGRIESVAEKLSKGRLLIYVGDNCPTFAESYRELSADCSSAPPQVLITDDDDGAIYFSSGTTGFPKAILHKHRSLTQAAEMEQKHHDIQHDDTFLCIPPLYHTGAKFHWMGSLFAGSKAVLLKGTSPEIILKAVSDEQCTIVWLLVPWAQDILDALDRGDIKLSDYKRVISVADTKVHGEFHFAGSHFVTFDRSALPYEQVITWFKAPEKEDTEIVSEQDGSGFQLNDLQTMKISDAIAERGHDYYRENRVRYISLDKTRVRAIVEGTQPYELECDYIDGEIRNLVCDCFCTYACKHMFAAMLQLKETLTFIEKHYPGRFEESRYFAAVCKETLLNTAMAGRETGSIML